MNIERLFEYTEKPSLFESGTSVMWTDPYISQQLLYCHIDIGNDMASRSDQKIELIINWILSKSKTNQMKILDLGCGPGLYAEKLARLGHHITGIDFSKHSITYAKGITEKNKSGIEYHCDNYLNINYENQFDLVILIYLDFCVLKPNERKIVLENVYRALKKGGVFIFDVMNSKNIDRKTLKPSWEVCASKGFWKDEPYIALNNGYHYPEHKVLVNQHIIIDQDDKIDTYLFWSTYYEYEDLAPVLNEAGFNKIKHYEKVLPEGDVWNGDNVTFYVIEKI
jgi:SAM-dependent methyltransferase